MLALRARAVRSRFPLANPTCSPQIPTSFSQSHARRSKLSPLPLNTAPSPNPESEASSELHKGKLTQPPQRHKRVADAKRGAKGKTLFSCSGVFVGWAGSGVRGLGRDLQVSVCRVSRAFGVLGWAWRRGAAGTTIFTSLRVCGPGRGWESKGQVDCSPCVQGP